MLRGAEWDLFREGLSCLWDEVEVAEEEDGPGTTGIAVFDELPKAERLAFLATVAKGLTDEDEPCPDLTALTEGTVAAIFAHIRYHIEVEIEFQEEAIASRSSEGFGHGRFGKWCSPRPIRSGSTAGLSVPRAAAMRWWSGRI